MTIESFAASAVEFALGNLAIALPLGLLAWWLQRKGTQPFLAHLIWLVVLVKLITPPLYSLRVDAAASAPPASMAYLPSPAGVQAPAAPDPAWLAVLDWKLVVVGLWLAGSVVVLGWLLTRAGSFHRLLRATSAPAPSALQQAASELAVTLGIARAPAVIATAARISPMVWWIGGPVRIYVPRSMIREMSHAELCDILAHELGHVARKDHYVRWLECLAGVVLWWNPVAWWARRNLRVCEEICCDAFVLSRTAASRDAYAAALVSAMELLAAPTIRPSGMASHVNGGFIERRIKMILSGNSIIEAPRWVRGTVIASAALLLPLGFTLAQDDAGDELAKARQWIESGVNSAFLTQEQADIMIRALEVGGHRITLVRDDEGEVFHVDGKVAVIGASALFDETATEAEIERALVFADTHFDEAVLTGRISPEDARALKTDLRDAIESGLAEGDGSAYYTQQFETGRIDAETAERRARMLRDMERAFNLSAQRLVMTDHGVHDAAHRVVSVEAAPVDIRHEGTVDLHVVEGLDRHIVVRGAETE